MNAAEIYKKEFEKHVQSSFRLHTEFKPLQLVGDVTGKSILDVSCGMTPYDKIYKKLGANEVVGIDSNQANIDLALKISQEEPLGIKYFCSDILQNEKFGDFDIVSAIYKFNFLEKKEQLYKVCLNMYQNLKSGGKLVGITINPDYKGITDFSDYYLTIMVYPNMKDEDVMHSKFMYKNGDNVSYKSYYYSKATYEDALRVAGFKNITWYPTVITKEGIQRYRT